jgi:anti-sigma B factor antagonist
MTLEISVSGDCDPFRVVSVAGEIDVAAAPSLAAKLEEVVAGGGVDIVLDLSEVTFLDSSGLGVLVKYLKRVLGAGGQIRLVVTNRAVRQVIEITRLDTVFAVYDDLDAALA